MTGEHLDDVLAAHDKWLANAGGERADLNRADLRHADLRHANLRDAYLGDADLRHANLRDADLRHADLRHANLRDAYLRHADLRHADLRHANLRDADLRDADLPIYKRLPDAGAFTVFKGCGGHVVRLQVPADADRVSSLIGPKCRVEFAEVVEVLNADGDACDATEATGWYDEGFVYSEGERVKPDEWDNDIRIQCTHGIHVYPTLREAVEAVR